MIVYIGLIRHIEAGHHVVTFPDLPGCVAVGATREQALGRAPGALARWIAALRRDGIAVPPPRRLDEIRVRKGLAFGAIGDGDITLVAARAADAEPAAARAALQLDRKAEAVALADQEFGQSLGRDDRA